MSALIQGARSLLSHAFGGRRPERRGFADGGVLRNESPAGGTVSPEQMTGTTGNGSVGSSQRQPGGGPAARASFGSSERGAGERFQVDTHEIAQMAQQVRQGMGLSGSQRPSAGTILRAGANSQMLTGLVRERYNAYVESLRLNSPRILLVGDSGLGKSNVVNIVFGFHPEQGGANVQAGGRPCTQNFAEYGPTDFSPVRIIDSRGVEKLTVQAQMEELRSYIESASRSSNVLDHVHLCWYFVGERWQEGDKFLVTELLKTCSVIIVLSKCDQRTDESARNIRAAVEADLGDICVAELGDPRGTRNWIPDSCPLGHGEEHLVVNLRAKTWTCDAEVGVVVDSGEPLVCSCHGDDSPFGHESLVKFSVELLPFFLRQSFLTAQRIDMSLKHKRAAAVIGSFTASAAGVGACPIPFADLPILLALEASMAASLIAVYGIPLDVFGADQLIGIHSGVVGVGGALGYFTAQFLKGIPGLNLAGASIDMAVAATAVATLGIAMCAVLTHYISQDTIDPEDARRMVGLVASQLDVSRAVRAVTTGHGNASSGQNDIVNIIEANTTEEALRRL